MLFLVLNLSARITLNKLCTMNLLFKTEKHMEKAVKREKKTICLILHKFYFIAHESLVLIMPENFSFNFFYFFIFIRHFTAFHLRIALFGLIY